MVYVVLGTFIAHFLTRCSCPSSSSSLHHRRSCQTWRWRGLSCDGRCHSYERADLLIGITSAWMCLVACWADAVRWWPEARKMAWNRPHVPSHLVAAYTCHVTALSWGMRIFHVSSWCHLTATSSFLILVATIVGPWLHIRREFVGKIPAYFTANLCI